MWQQTVQLKILSWVSCFFVFSRLWLSSWVSFSSLFLSPFDSYSFFLLLHVSLQGMNFSLCAEGKGRERYRDQETRKRKEKNREFGKEEQSVWCKKRNWWEKNWIKRRWEDEFRRQDINFDSKETESELNFVFLFFFFFLFPLLLRSLWTDGRDKY